MWEAMRGAAQEAGMASAGEDANVAALERGAAELFGQEAALFVPTTTTGTSLALANAAVGERLVVAEARSHFYWVERAHWRMLQGARVVPVMGDRFGAFDVESLEKVVMESCYDVELELGLICLENTHNVCGGTYLTPGHMRQMRHFADRTGALVYLDGARLLNAAVAQDVPAHELSGQADIVVITLSKGLLAPMGALLCGARDLIEGARVVGRRLGSMNLHKAGIFAAAARVALDGVAGALAQDHRRARALAEELREIDGLGIDLDTVQTNLVRVDTTPSGLPAREVATRLLERDLAVHVLAPWAFKMAAYRGITDAHVDEAIEIIRDVMANLEGQPEESE
jgi:threonine aldolase